MIVYPIVIPAVHGIDAAVWGTYSRIREAIVAGAADMTAGGT